MQQVEGVEGNAVTRMRRTMLERLEGWTAAGIDRDDFAVERRTVGIEVPAGGRDRRIDRRHVLVVAGANLDLAVVLQQQRTVAIELDLVNPVIALGELVDQSRRHRGDECRDGGRTSGSCHGSAIDCMRARLPV